MGNYFQKVWHIIRDEVSANIATLTSQTSGLHFECHTQMKTLYIYINEPYQLLSEMAELTHGSHYCRAVVSSAISVSQITISIYVLWFIDISKTLNASFVMIKIFDMNCISI